ncbi:hypothetical protein QYS49_23985 [Marivirga salinae]|uniref:Uncharacterized protein n=1 Tax=Marivirga salinarum TaxID=3059078 RepID=A0AA49GAD8_9BACT|nr:hypothetical protein [Marivirga sp. BDSF4-3]WKK74730.2 hypothetical protein QYS49_23985 [Marivirga sp. BDSF4-3]
MKNETDALTVRISQLEEKRAEELSILKAQFQTTKESLEPFNLIKSTIDKVSSSSEIKNNIIGSAIGIGTAVFSKKILMGGSHNPIKNILGTLIQFAIGNVVSKNANEMKSKVGRFIHFFMKRRRKAVIEVQEANVQNMDELTEYGNEKKIFRN